MSSSTRACIVSVIRAPKLVVLILHLSSACEKQENGKCLDKCGFSNVSIFSIAICCPREEAHHHPPLVGPTHPHLRRTQLHACSPHSVCRIISPAWSLTRWPHRPKPHLASCTCFPPPFATSSLPPPPTLSPSLDLHRRHGEMRR